MNPHIFSWIIYGSWVLLVVYLTVTAVKAKPDPEPDLGQSFGLMYALFLAFALPYVPLLNSGASLKSPPAKSAMRYSRSMLSTVSWRTGVPAAGAMTTDRISERGMGSVDLRSSTGSTVGSQAA